jgi:hypothetical protein
MKKEYKIVLVVAALAVAAYLAIKWYENRQAASNGNTQGGAADGSNLNSIAPELVGGSTGPSIGPALSTPITINVTSGSPPASANPTVGVGPIGYGGGTPMQPLSTATPSPLALANPSNSSTGVQAAAPVNDTAAVPAGATAAGVGATAAVPQSSSGPVTVTASGKSSNPVNKTPPRTTKAKPTPIKRVGAPPKAKPKAKAPVKK